MVMVTMAAAIPAASAQARWPVIGCQDRHDAYANHYAWEYKPSRLCASSGTRGTLTGIDHAHWKHWGRRKATARGMLVFGQGVEFPARIIAYGLIRTHDFLGQGTYAAWYSDLHVVSPGGHLDGVHLGPFNLTLGVTPQT
jgi:hypothetical protein